jgi:hypothetical protein
MTRSHAGAAGRRVGEDFRVIASPAAARLAMLCDVADEHVSVAAY